MKYSFKNTDSLLDFFKQKISLSNNTAVSYIETCIKEGMVQINDYLTLETNKYKDNFFVTIR